MALLDIPKESEYKLERSKNINEIVQMRFYEFSRLPIFFPSCDFYNDYEFPGISIFSHGCDFHSVFYSLYGYSTNSNLS